jgi:hypothetical protein
MKKPTPKEDGFMGHDAPCPCKLSERFPCLWRFVADDRWDDGSIRESGTVTLMVDQGWCKAALNDRGQRLVAFVTSDSLEGLLRAVDKGLVDETLEWRPWREDGGGKRR